MIERSGIKRILIVKPSSFGDIVHALPALRLLRRRFPEAHISWLVKRQWAELLQCVEGLDTIWAVEPTVRGWLSQIVPLRRARFDAVVDLQGLLRSAATGRLAGCPIRVGFADGREGAPFFYTHRIEAPDTTMHAIDRYLMVAGALGSSEGPPAMGDGAWEFGLRVEPADRDAIAAVLNGRGVASDAAWIAVHASARWPTKRWPPESFSTALDVLQKDVGRVVFVGGPDEVEDSRAIIERMTTVPADLTGKTSLRLLVALLQSAAVVISGDSGPMHLAAAVGTPVVALFGPSSAAYSGPRGPSHRILESKIPCSPCFSVVCRNTIQLECLHRITPQAVIDAVRDILNTKVKAQVQVEAAFKAQERNRIGTSDANCSRSSP
jgi:heptosyltransferase-1